jgi:hypothetical protein
MKARRRKAFLGPGAASATELERSHFVGLTPARWLALFIATGIGLHNFSEGLAIGQAAALDKLSLAYVLVIGFGLHNATEGFGIVAPLTGDAEPPSWRFLALLGVIGGFPTFFGTMVGQAWTSTGVSILFLSLAAGSILYVVMELLNVCRLFSSKTVTAWGLLLGSSPTSFPTVRRRARWSRSRSGGHAPAGWWSTSSTRRRPASRRCRSRRWCTSCRPPSSISRSGSPSTTAPPRRGRSS